MRFQKSIASATAAASLFALAACDPAQQEGTTVTVGDSITFTMSLSGGNSQTPAVEQYTTGLGWEASTPEIVQSVEDEVAAGQVDELVVALGTNDSRIGTYYDVYHPGWDEADEAAWLHLFDLTPDVDSTNAGDTDGTCFSIIVPWVTWGTGVTQARLDEQDQAISFMEELAATHPDRVRLTYWKDYIDPDGDRIADPEIIRDDGVHLQDDDNPDDWQLNPPAVAARAASINEAVDKCSAMVTAPTPTSTTAPPTTTVPDTTTTTGPPATTTTTVAPSTSTTLTPEPATTTTVTEPPSTNTTVPPFP